MNESLAPPVPPPPPTPSFAHQAAKGSWVSAAIVFGVIAFGGRSGAKLVVELMALLLMITGLILGAIALFGLRRHGTKGILWPALAGLAINGLIMFIFATNFVTARARALEAANTASSPTLASPSSK